MLAVLATLLLAVLGALVVRARQAGVRSVSAPLCLLSLLALTAFAIQLEHVLFRARYPVGRTALFIVPLFMLAVITALDAACRIGRRPKACASAVLLLGTALAGWHFGRVANVSRAYDWADDAFTRSVVADVRRMAGERADRPATVSLGVDALFLPAAVYYADRPGTPAIRLVGTPTIEPLDFLFTRAAGPETNGEVVRQFPSGATLVRQNPAH